ncbi:hypothetical protein ACQ5SO_01270 [Rhodovulum sp. DZ06]|uniref:hypothetical protein n=1 Tax=Rhodovulum sp. DZ06 TaxID=3425126 RepID=UPI003D32F4AC
MLFAHRPAARALRAALFAAPLALSAAPAAADEVEDAIEAGLEAYRAGDVALAKEELDFASQLLAQQKAEGLSGFLPAPLDGWTREMGDGQAMAASMFGGGIMASADYAAPDGAMVTIQMMADNAMVASMGAMLGNPAAMGAMGKVIRVGRQKAVQTPEGDVQALVANRVLVMVEGDAPAEVKLDYFKAIDFRALGDM